MFLVQILKKNNVYINTMSLVSFIRDYNELLINLSDSLGNQLTFSKVITGSIFYILETLKYTVTIFWVFNGFAILLCYL